MVTEELLKTIAAQGLVGVFLVLAMGTVCYMYKELKKERDSRLNDMKEVWQEDVKFKTELKNLLDVILELLRKGGK